MQVLHNYAKVAPLIGVGNKSNTQLPSKDAFEEDYCHWLNCNGVVGTLQTIHDINKHGAPLGTSGGGDSSSELCNYPAVAF